MMQARGGYGLTRVLHLIDWNRVASSGKAFVGFTDFTAFNMAAYANANLLTYQGPMVGIDFGDGMGRHPTQLYEIAAAIVIGAIILIRMRRPYARGDARRASRRSACRSREPTATRSRRWASSDPTPG